MTANLNLMSMQHYDYPFPFLPEDFVKEYDIEKDLLRVDLIVKSLDEPNIYELVPTRSPWSDLGYVASCCKEGGYYAIRLPKHSIEGIRIRRFLNPLEDLTSQVPPQEFVLDQRSLRQLARDYQVRQGYLEYN